ncbi:MAG: hypothetical protein IRZ03_17625 [Acidobacterium ailaaui]|nr:hypothetical protein [Pseudacidobacterium ailaaui]
MSYKNIDVNNDISINSYQYVSPAWSGGSSYLSGYFTSSFQETSNSGLYFLNVYQSSSFDPSSEIQFNISWGDMNGSGSSFYNSLVPYNTPTKSVYMYFRNLIYGDESSVFTFGNPNYTSSNFVCLSISRDRFKDSILPGSIALYLSNGSNNIVLVDDSSLNLQSSYIGTSRIYNLLSGSVVNNVPTPLSSNYTVVGSYGFIVPDKGLIFLNPSALSLPPGPLGGIGVNFNFYSSSQCYSYFNSLGYTYNLNNRIFFNLLNGFFYASSIETITSEYIFVNAGPNEFNYTTNPTIIDSSGNLLYPQLIYNPQVYITTVGLYNDQGDLLAVARFNKPLLKDFTKSLNIRIKLDF